MTHKQSVKFVNTILMTAEVFFLSNDKKISSNKTIIKLNNSAHGIYHFFVFLLGTIQILSLDDILIFFDISFHFH